MDEDGSWPQVDHRPNRHGQVARVGGGRIADDDVMIGGQSAADDSAAGRNVARGLSPPTVESDRVVGTGCRVPLAPVARRVEVVVTTPEEQRAATGMDHERVLIRVTVTMGAVGTALEVDGRAHGVG